MMKAITILGAIIGFLIGTAFGLAANSPWPTTLWRACAAALFVAVIGRWWTHVWIKSLNEAIAERHNLETPPAPQPSPATKA